MTPLVTALSETPRLHFRSQIMCGGHVGCQHLLHLSKFCSRHIFIVILNNRFGCLLFIYTTVWFQEQRCEAVFSINSRSRSNVIYINSWLCIRCKNNNELIQFVSLESWFNESEVTHIYMHEAFVNIHLFILKKPTRCTIIYWFCFSCPQYIMQRISENKCKRSFSCQTQQPTFELRHCNGDEDDNHRKKQDNHPHRVLLTTLADTHNISCHPSL